MALIMELVLSSTGTSSPDLLITAFMSLFFLYSIFCGVLCLRMKSSALTHSLINQFLQLISFIFSGFAFMYVAGIYFMIVIDLSASFEIIFGLGISAFQILINGDSPEFVININLIALAAILWIEKLKLKIRSENRNLALSSLEHDQPGP